MALKEQQISREFNKYVGDRRHLNEHFESQAFKRFPIVYRIQVTEENENYFVRLM